MNQLVSILCSSSSSGFHPTENEVRCSPHGPRGHLRPAPTTLARLPAPGPLCLLFPRPRTPSPRGQAQPRHQLQTSPRPLLQPQFLRSHPCKKSNSLPPLRSLSPCLPWIPPWHLSPTGTPCLFVHCLPLHSRPNAAPSGWELSVLFTVIAPNVVGRCSKNILECKHACVRDQLCNLKSIWGHPKLRLSHTDQSE